MIMIALSWFNSHSRRVESLGKMLHITMLFLLGGFEQAAN